MYTIGNVIYGIPITYEIGRILLEQEQNSNDNDPFWSDEFFELLYHGSSNRSVGYCGVLLKTFDECDDPGTKLSDIVVQPTDEQKQEAQAMIDRLPQEIKTIIPEVNVWIVWSTS